MGKSMDFMRKVMDDKEDLYEQIVAPIKSHLCKIDCTNLLNKILFCQSFHNNVDLKNLTISTDPKTGAPLIANVNDRKIVIK